MNREAPAHLAVTRDDFPYRLQVPTRWGDNDMLGHLNNVVYHRIIETVVVRFTLDRLGVDWQADAAYPVSVDSRCRFHRQLSFPETVEAALRIAKIGNTSVTFDLALFGEDEEVPAATGHFVHVYIDRDGQQATPLPTSVREILENLA